MANIKNHITNQVSVVAIPEKPIDIYSVDISAIKAKFITIIKDSQPVITQFPDLLLVVDTNNQFAVNIIKQNNRIMIADSRITNYENRNLDDFYRLVTDINNIIVSKSNKILSFGFNIISIFDIEGEEIKDSGDEIKKRFLNQKYLDKTFNNIVSAGIKVAHEEKDVRYELVLEPRLGPNLESTKQINANLNAHHKQEMPDLSTLQKESNLIYSSLGKNLVKIFE